MRKNQELHYAFRQQLKIAIINRLKYKKLWT